MSSRESYSRLDGPQLIVRLPREMVDLLVTMALMDQSTLGEQLRRALGEYVFSRIQDIQ